MKTAKAKIHVDKDKICVEFDDQVVRFNLFNSIIHLESSTPFICQVDVIDSVVQNVFVETNYDIEQDEKNAIDENSNEGSPSVSFPESFEFNAEITVPNDKSLPSVVQGPKIELKALPEHLKYMYIGDSKTFRVIISKELTAEQEERLIQVLKENKLAIGWTLVDIKGINPVLCMHRIRMEDDVKPTREPQTRLNSTLMDVVKKEIEKLRQSGIIYPISDSKWVSPIHVVPKKIGFTVIKNKDNELVPNRIQNGWKMCVDYRKLNSSTRKDHFPIPFID